MHILLYIAIKKNETDVVFESVSIPIFESVTHLSNFLSSSVDIQSYRNRSDSFSWVTTTDEFMSTKNIFNKANDYLERGACVKCTSNPISTNQSFHFSHLF